MKRDHEFVAGSSIQPRLPRVDEEKESDAEEAYSEAGSDDEYAFRVDVQEVVDGEEDGGGDSVGRTNGDVGGKGKGVDHGAEFERHYPRPPLKATAVTAPRSWSDLNLSMIVALVSPIGNWLTGSDHVKNLLLLMLLIFYLHQLIEVPWKLYHSSRPRRHRDPARSAEDPHTTLAYSALRAREIFFLVCTVVTPFAGSLLIRHVFAAIEGVDNLSWFSTTLFVLATGIRPWTHLVSRLQERTDELHSVIHQQDDEEHDRQVNEKLDTVMKRLDALERTLREVQTKAGRISPLQEVCDDMSEALETVERTVHRQERRTESARVSHNNRLAVVENAVVRLGERQRHQARSTAAHAHTANEGIYIPLPPLLSVIYLRLCHDILCLKTAASKRIPFLVSPPPAKTTAPSASPILGSPVSSPPISPSGSAQFFNGTPLETIPEAADSDSDGTYVSEPDGTSTRAEKKPSRSRSRSTSGVRPSLRRRKTLGRGALEYASAVVSWPYRFAVRLLLVVVPMPMRKYFV